MLGRYPSDGPRLVYFVREFLLSSLASAHLPLWNPFTFFGTPFYVNMQVATFYPLNLPFIAFNPSVAYNLFIGLHLGMAGVFMYLLARTWDLTQGPAAVSSIAYMLNGGFVGYSWGGDINMLSAAIWMPLVLLLFDKAIGGSKQRLGWMLAASAAFGIETLSGHPQYTFFTAFALFVAAVFRGWQVHRARGTLGQALVPLGLWVAVLGLAALLAAVQLLPTYEGAQVSTRHFEWNFTWPATPIEGSYNPVRLATWVVPDLFGNPVSLRPAATDWLSLVLKEVHSNEFRAYIGILPLALAVFAFTGWRENPRIRFLGILAGIGLLLAFGGFTPAYGLGNASLPPVRTFRIPARFLSLVVFAAALLAGFGAQALLSNAKRHARLWGRGMLVVAAAIMLGVLGATVLRSKVLDVGQKLAEPVFANRPLGRSLDASARDKLIVGAYDLAVRGSGVAAVLVGLTGVLFLMAQGAAGRKQGITIALVGLTAVDVGLQGLPYTSFERVDDVLAQQAGLVRALDEAGREGRVIMLSRGIGTGGPDLLRPGENAFMHYRVLGAGGFDSFELATYRAAVDGIAADLRLGSPTLAAAFGVRYIVTDLPLPLPEFRVLAHIGPATLYENKEALPRFYLARESRTVASSGDALAALREQEDSIGKTVFIEGSVTTPSTTAWPGKGRIDIMVADPARLVLRVKAEKAAILVANETFYPGWRGSVDGMETPIYRANGLVRAMPIPEGTHLVELRFAPRTLVMGMWISVCIAVILIVAAGFSVAREVRKAIAHRNDRQSAAAS